MITSLRTTNIFRVLDAIPAITALVEVFSEKPAEEFAPDDSYLYLSIINDTTTTATDSGVEGWSLIKEAVVSFNIVAWVNSAKTDTDELFDIIDVINEETVDEGCQKITTWDWVKMKKVTELAPSPIAYDTKNRAVIIKQYLFTYYAK